jgi:hypothetical protein
MDAHEIEVQLVRDQTSRYQTAHVKLGNRDNHMCVS